MTFELLSCNLNLGMQTSCKKRYRLFIILSIFLFFSSLLSAKEVSLLADEAISYRKKGLEYQTIGRLDDAMASYRKAILLDPGLAAAYNDLGIIYEAKGMKTQAEETYLAGLKINPNYPHFYTNLAMLYESKKDYLRAIEFWEKRKELGKPTEAWRQKAIERLDALIELLPDDLKEQYYARKAEELALALAEQIRAQRVVKVMRAEEAARLFAEAKRLYQKAEYENAINSLDLALNLEPDNRLELLRFRYEIIRKAETSRIEGYFPDAMIFKRQ